MLCSYQVFTVTGENENLPLKILTQKLALLMALVGANRVSELQALDLRLQTRGCVFSTANFKQEEENWSTS